MHVNTDNSGREAPTSIASTGCIQIQALFRRVARGVTNGYLIIFNNHNDELLPFNNRGSTGLEPGLPGLEPSALEGPAPGRAHWPLVLEGVRPLKYQWAGPLVAPVGW